MMDDPPPPAEVPSAIVATQAPATPLMEQRADGTLVVDLMQLVPPPPSDCVVDEPDPFNPEIVVCDTSAPTQRLGPQVGPVDDGFASAIPRARIKLSENAEAQANVAKTPVGGFDADGAEVRLKIGF